MNSPNLTRPRAVAPPDGHPEPGVPWHFGDPFAEQRAAARGAAVVDRSHRQVLAVRGADRLSWLHLVISQHVTELPVGGGTEALVLDAKGRLEAHLVLGYADGSDTAEPTVWLDADPGVRVTSALPKGGPQSLPEYLDAMRFWSAVTITDATDDRAVLSVLGPHAREVLTAAGLVAGTGAYATVTSAGGRPPEPPDGS
ncbi:MAG: folate-binding protein, partial [Thermocrispum sp.]